MGRMTGTWRKTGTGRSRGIALVIVLWGLVLLAVIAAAFTTETRTEVALARNLVENAKARALADAGIYRAIMGMTQPGAEHGWAADGTVYGLALGDGGVSITLADESGKIDLNAVPAELIRGLFIVLGLEENEATALADAIADFRDTDDLTRLHGAEDSDYRAAGLAWEAKDAPFIAVEEVQQVLGMTRELYARAAPFLTVYTRSRGVDPRAAAREVLLAIPGVDEGTVEIIHAARIAEAEGAAPTPLPALTGVRRYTIRSREEVLLIRAKAQTKGGAVFVREAVVRLMANDINQPFRIYAWRRGRLPLQTIGTGDDVPDIALAPAAGPAAPTASPAPKKAPLTTTGGVTLKIRPPTARGDGDETPAMEPPSIERPPLRTAGREKDAPATTAAPAVRTPPPGPPVSSPAPAARPIARLPSPAAKARRAPSASPPAATVKKQVTKKPPTKKTPSRAAAAPAGYRVQLGAFESERIARQEMARIVEANRDLLGDLGAAVRRADLGAKGVFYRVRVGPLAARKEARTLCASLSERKVPCFVVSAGKQ